LVEIAPAGLRHVHFTPGGSEAVEVALKLAFQYHWLRGEPQRRRVICRRGAYHGVTMGALSLTAVPAMKAPFEPLVPGVEFVPYGDVEALRAAVDDDTAAVFLEPMQGEAGVICPPEGYLEAAREACDAAGALLVIDEVQTGNGRTGKWFAHQYEDVVPDVITMAKGLAGGLPIGVCIGIGDYANGLLVGHHGSTFGGNPVVCAAACTVLDVIERDGLLENAVMVGDALAEGIESVDDPLIAGVRGRGLLRAIVLSEPVGVEIGEAAARAGFLVAAVRPNAVRIAPPLILTLEDVEEFVAALPGILADTLVAAPAS
jgi:acetylornithine aminotransferase